MLVQYLGAHDRYRPECDLAYDNQLMVMLWSALAARDVRLAEGALTRRRPAPAPAAWVTYLRCHDDIGWAVSDADAAAAGLGGYAHRRFLNDFYAGRFPGSFARGALFQDNPATGDARISGSAASLCGIESALAAGDAGELTLAIRRLESMYAVVFSFGGIPLIYMGDELAMLNDPRWREDPAHADDNRWMHRPPMDWDRAARRHIPDSLEGRVFTAIQQPHRGAPVPAGAKVGRHDRDPAGREPARARVPPGPSAQCPVPVAHQLQRRPAGRGRRDHGPGRAARAAARALHGGRTRPQRGPDRASRVGLPLAHRHLTGMPYPAHRHLTGMAYRLTGT